MSVDPAIRDHQAWLGYLQPDGLVVSPAALVDAQVLLDRNALPLQQRFLPHVAEVKRDDADPLVVIPDFAAFVQGFLEWPADCLVGLDPDRPVPASLFVQLDALGEELRPTFAFQDPKPGDAANPWLLLVQVLPVGTDLDAARSGQENQWSASAGRRFERLLQETQVPIGLLTNGTQVRLVYAPHGENSGSITFPVHAMAETAGRPILAAFHTLLEGYRLLAAPTEARLPALLVKSREYQGRVSTELAQQVLDALYELLRGFQAADERTRGELLRDTLARDPAEVYSALLTVLMRTVFLLYAEDRGLMPGSPLYVRNYAVHGLFERLRSDYERYPDTMDHRYGAWARLLALFRAVHGGCRHPQMHMPARHGYLFDPARFPFLEGGAREPRPDLPLVSDGIVYRVLDKLLLLDGERLSYRTLDVEQIGSVYEAIMGFRLEVTRGPTVAIRPAKAHGAPAAVNLDTLLDTKPADRAKWLLERTDQKLNGEATAALKDAASVDDLLAALERKIARNATPHVVPKGAMVLQPSDERRRSGSHYTPRSLTEPIVRKTLAPVLDRLGPNPEPDRILALKICDPAVGSGAFLVEVSRQLAERLVASWHAHGKVPEIPPDEDESLYARRLVAQCSVYGVDRNPMAVDLTKLSLWLATLAKDHPFTFLDHLIKSGDSLVGLTARQIAAFWWKSGHMKDQYSGQDEVGKQIKRAAKARTAIIAMPEDNAASVLLKRAKLGEANEAAESVRHAGDLAIAAFFNADKEKARTALRDQYLQKLLAFHAGGEGAIWLTETLKDLRSGLHPVTPFHWEIEFPEVFDRERPGFDAFVGNPPFAGKNTLLNGNREGYLDWLKILHEESHGNADLVAHFFRRAYNLLRPDGCFGLIATNTIGQGDTRHSGLRWICTHGGTIFAARKRYKWPGQAAVVVSVVWVGKMPMAGPFDLDGRPVPIITAYLFHAGGHENPATLLANQGKSFIGSYVLGMGFTFDDTDTSGVANPLSLMHELISKDRKNAERILPYLGGKEINDHPEHRHHRYVINFEDFPLRREDLGASWELAEDKQRAAWRRTGIVPLDYRDPVAADWPALLQIVKSKVKPERDGDSRDGYRRYWWQFAEKRGDLSAALREMSRTLVVPRTSHHLAAVRVPTASVFSENLVVLVGDTWAAFGVLQSAVHHDWVRFTSSTLEDRQGYRPSDCFETFPFPPSFEANDVLASAGRAYYEFRAALMVRNNEGLTKTYNRFHDPNETSPDILKLRELHAAMDRAVLDAYGWTDIPTDCEFLLDYEDEEDEGSRRKKPWRHRWPDPIRDEVLARLLALNAQRAEEERLASTPAPEPAARGKRRRTITTDKQLGLEL